MKTVASLSLIVLLFTGLNSSAAPSVDTPKDTIRLAPIAGRLTTVYKAGPAACPHTASCAPTYFASVQFVPACGNEVVLTWDVDRSGPKVKLNVTAFELIREASASMRCVAPNFKKYDIVIGPQPVNASEVELTFSDDVEMAK